MLRWLLPGIALATATSGHAQSGRDTRDPAILGHASPPVPCAWRPFRPCQVLGTEWRNNNFTALRITVSDEGENSCRRVVYRLKYSEDRADEHMSHVYGKDEWMIQDFLDVNPPSTAPQFELVACEVGTPERAPAPKPEAQAAQKKEDKPSGFSSFMSRWGSTIVGVTAGVLASGKVAPQPAKQILEIMQQQQAGGASGGGTEIASGDCAAVEQQVANEINGLPKTGHHCDIMRGQRDYYRNRGIPSMESACTGNPRGERGLASLRSSLESTEKSMRDFSCR